MKAFYHLIRDNVVTTVEWDELPRETDMKFVSPTEVVKGKMPQGFVDSSHIPSRAIIVIEAEHTEPKFYYGIKARCFNYRSATRDELGS